jgi:hypothetical protein
MRDERYRREIGVPSIAGQVRLLTADAVQAGPAGVLVESVTVGPFQQGVE